MTVITLFRHLSLLLEFRMDHCFCLIRNLSCLLFLRTKTTRVKPNTETSEYLTSEMRTHAMTYYAWGMVWNYNTSFTFDVTTHNPSYATIYLGVSTNNDSEGDQRFKDNKVS